MVGSADTSGSAVSSGEKPLSPASSDADASSLRVDFYVMDTPSASARLKLACRLAEKAYLSSQTALVWHTDVEELKAFDEMLWTFMDGSFVPHDVLSTDSPVSADTPVILSAGVSPPKHFDVVINLAPEVPACLSQTARIAEIIDGEESRRRAGRVRFKAYRDLGIQPATHNIRAE